jgi:hypothetical protein
MIMGARGPARDDALVDEDQRREVLRGAEEEVRRVSRARGWGSPQAEAARRRCLELERSTAAELGWPYAQPVELGVKWDTGAPMPVLLAGLRTFVAFYLSIRDPRFDRLDIGRPDPLTDHGIGIVEFKQVTSVKIGSPNDEVLHGHPLWGSGLEYYRAHEVRNSPWITELMTVNRVHERFDESRWSGKHHFILTFHDETLECVAQMTVTRTAPGATMPEVIARLSRETL